MTVDEEVEIAQARRRRTRRAIRPLGVVIVALLVGAAGSLYIRQDADPVTIDEALAQYRATSAVAPAAEVSSAPPGAAVPDAEGPGTTVATVDDPSPSRPAAAPSTGAQRTGVAPRAQVRRPQPGVYTFDTEGYEYVDALGGSRHDYPRQTAMSIRSHPCGWVQRWQPLDERWDESELCVEPGGVAIRRFTTFHSFFQRGMEQTYPCPAGSLVYNNNTTPGHAWSLQCKGEAGTVTMKIHNVGHEDLVIGGKQVRALRIRYDATLAGANRGHQTQDRWFDPATGMNVRIETDIETESDSPFGIVHYEEHYSITATSLTPRT